MALRPIRTTEQSSERKSTASRAAFYSVQRDSEIRSGRRKAAAVIASAAVAATIVVGYPLFRNTNGGAVPYKTHNAPTSTTTETTTALASTTTDVTVQQPNGN
jgi:hypothetical protein